MKIPPRLRDFATALQKEAIDAVNKHGTVAAAARALGVKRTALKERIRLARKRAARAGYAPEHDYTHPQPEGFHVKGVSTMYAPDGTIRAQWVKSQKDTEDRLEALKEAIGILAEPIAGKSKPVPAPQVRFSDLLAVYPMGDPHIGMLSWAIETGADFDLKIAERNLVTATTQLVALAPPAEQALIINVGDFFHADNQSNVTMRSGHQLDVDSRWVRVLQVGIRAMTACIDAAKAKHARVKVINEIGNHDDHSALMLSLCLAAYYRNDPRVEIDTSPSTYHFHRFGRCLIGVTHGNNTKPDKLPLLMAQRRQQDWGETAFRHWYTGHVHHDSVKEYVGATVETLRTLAPKDAYAARAGYDSARDMKLDVWHDERGRIVRHIIGIEQVEAVSGKGAA